MRIALLLACVLACLTFAACGGGGGDDDGHGDDPGAVENRWNQMDWNDGEWA